MLTGERKFHDPFSFMNKARLVFSCNEIPKNYGDRTDAFYRRLVFLIFDHQVSSDKVDTTLSDKLAKEKDGIVQWALEGLYRLQTNDYRFSEPAVSKELLVEYRLESDSVLWLIENFCEVGQKNVVNSLELYAQYRNRCEQSNLRPVSQITFNKTLNSRFGNVINRTKEVGTRRVIYTGINVIQTLLIH